MDNENSVTFSASGRPGGAMDKELHPLQALRGLRLTAAEKDHMLAAILEAPSPVFGFFSSLQRILAVSLAVVLLAGSGVSYAAESALPGDMLYIIKVHVNERVRGSFQRSTHTRARWEVRLAKRRLEEGETLTARGRMNGEMREHVREHFRRHAQQVAIQLETLLETQEMEAAAEISADFEAGLRAHESVLARLERVSDRVASEASLLLEIRDFLRTTKEARVIAQARSRMIAGTGIEAAARTTIAAADREIKAARGALRKKADRNPRLAEEATVKLFAAEERLREAEEKMEEAEAQDAASTTLDTVSFALSTAQEVSLILKYTENAAVSITTLPEGSTPPTAENGLRQHAQARIDVAGKRITDTHKLLEKRKDQLTDEETKKVQEALKRAETAFTDAQANLETGAFADAITHADSAIAHAKQARKIILRERTDDQSASVNTSIDAETQMESSVGTEGSSLEIKSVIEGKTRVKLP